MTGRIELISLKNNMCYLENELKEVCLGHTIYFKKECKYCKQDEFNKHCDKYKSLKIIYIKNDNINTDKRN